MTRFRKTAAFLASAIVLLGTVSWALAEERTNEPVILQDSAPFHVHPEGRPFALTVRIDLKDAPDVRAVWKDFAGNVLGGESSMRANGKDHTIVSPSGEPGYYGLVLLPPSGTAWPGLQPGETREFGFAVLPHPLKGGAAESPFGTVHADPADPFMPPWTKTATWMTAPSGDWAALIGAARKHGKIELPIIAGKAWDSDDAFPVTEHQLDELEREAKIYFDADGQSAYWETGIEENLSDNYGKPRYWDNLRLKILRLRAAAKSANRNIKFIYQVAGAETPDIERFIQSPASKEFDVLSVHPYAWPSFPPPDLWLEDFLRNVNTLKTRYRAGHPVWFTEVGAPHFGNYPGGFFGYPDRNEPTGGLSRKDAAAYVVKMCVIALSNGVEKIFWYNYRDAGAARDQAEAHFGLRDYWGFPKPAYAAYYTTVRLLQDAKPSGFRSVLNGEVSLHTFDGGYRRVAVAWAKPGRRISLPLKKLGPAFEADKVLAVDAVGHPVAHVNGLLPIGDSPVFIETKTAKSRP